MEGYVSGQYLFIYSRSGSLFWAPFLTLLKKSSRSYRLCNCWTLVNLMNDQAFSLQRNRFAANLQWLFYQAGSCRRWIPMKDFREQRFNSLPFIASLILHLISSREFYRIKALPSWLHLAQLISIFVGASFSKANALFPVALWSIWTNFQSV